jgi:hypothetical protein
MITEVENWIGQTVPPSYRAFLSTQVEDFPLGDFILLYGLSSFLERVVDDWGRMPYSGQ